MDIQAKEISTSETAEVLELRVDSFIPNAEQIGIYFKLKDNEGNFVSDGTLQLTGSDLAKWGKDDNYLYDWACAQLGITKA